MKEPLPALSPWAHLRYHLGRFSGYGGLYGLTLSGRAADAPPPRLDDPWPGDPKRGQAILDNDFTFFGKTIHQERNPWESPGAGKDWLSALNGFAWLRDLRALGGEQAVEKARALTLDWAERNQGPNALSHGGHGWDAAVTGNRVAAWLVNWQALFETAELNYRHRLLTSLGRQLRHLQRIAPFAGNGSDRIAAIKGWIMAAALLPGEQRNLTAAVNALTRELMRQVNPDGGHLDRTPQQHFQLLRDLLEIRIAFRTAGADTPYALQSAIDRMTPYLRMMRHGDGGLALFNGAHEGQAAAIDRILAEADVRGRVPMSAPHTGYERLQAGKLLALVDTGGNSPLAGGGGSHAGCLSLEISDGRERMVVNCGGAREGDGEWMKSLRATAAHSTLCVEGTNSSSLLPEGGLGARRAIAEIERQETDGAIWLTGSHEGYLSKFGLRHTRRLYMPGEGDDLRGEDQLTGPSGHEFAIRFHLHPRLSVSLLHNQASALLKLPGGAGWRLRVHGADMALEDSIYFGEGGEMKRCQQIVLSGRVEGESAAVKWGFHREKK